MYVASAVAKDHKSNPEWRPYFLLCLYCYNILIRCFRMVQWIVPGLLAIAVQSGAITSREAQYIKMQFRDSRDREIEGKPMGGGAGFVLDMDRAVTDVRVIPYSGSTCPCFSITFPSSLCFLILKCSGTRRRRIASRQSLRT